VLSKFFNLTQDKLGPFIHFEGRTTLETNFAFIGILQAGQTSSITVAAAEATFIPSSRTPAATDLRSKSYAPPAVLPMVCHAVVLVVVGTPAPADVITTGDVDPSGAGPCLIWTPPGDLYVGKTGTGTLTANAGCIVNNVGDGYIGYNRGSTGTATVSDSWWDNRGSLSVGYLGDGTLNVIDGGLVDNIYGYIGEQSGSVGTVTVNGEGSRWNTPSWLSVGGSGTGTLEITAGGVVTNTYGYIGQNEGRIEGRIGEATVTGMGSEWNNSSNLYVGTYDGTGTLNIADNGLVTVGGTTEIGTTAADGGSGTLNLSGSGLVTVAGTTKLFYWGTINLDGGNFNFHDGTLTINGTDGVFDPGVNDFSINGNAADKEPHLVIANTASTSLAGDLEVGSTRQGPLE